ncbi:MAG: hypothetical protein J0G30_13500 [Actinomycetales bacterium]|nr:hypothetical protein [Actinomycetales bacterium]
MKNVLLLAVGAAAGIIAAHYISKTPQGKAFFDDVDAKAAQFGQAVKDGYQAREAEIRDAMADARARFDEFTDR